MRMIDPAMELPVELTVEPGNAAEKKLFPSLVADFRERYDIDEFPCEGVLADAEYDTSECREAAEEILDAPLATAINPRRSTTLQALNNEIKEVFEEHGDEIETPYGALELTRTSAKSTTVVPV